MAKQFKINSLHKRNIHQGRYDLQLLAKSLPELKTHIFINEHNIETVDFFNPKAVICLNKALLLHYYQIKEWSIPDNYLCPPIPGRANYIHYIADLLSEKSFGKIPKGDNVKGLDIGTGANYIYPLLGNAIYGWSFSGSETDDTAINNAQKIITDNSLEKLELVKQNDSQHIFKGIIKPNDRYDFTMCNPPFHSSKEEALQGSQRKIKNLTGEQTKTPTLNFGGQSNELWCPGGELLFIKTMVSESKLFADQVGWFSTLVSKSKHLKAIEAIMDSVQVKNVKEIKMGQGNKTNRIIAWNF